MFSASSLRLAYSKPANYIAAKEPGYRNLLLFVLAVSMLPILLNFLGISFSVLNETVLHKSPNISATEKLRGSYLATFFECCSFCIAAATIYMSYLHFSIRKDHVTPVIATALLCSAMLDGVHVLVTDRFIGLESDSTKFSTLTWLISRTYNAAVIFLIPLIILNRNDSEPKGRFSGRFISPVAFAFAAVTFLLIVTLLNLKALPQINFTCPITNRPCDGLPLLLFAINLFVVLPFFFGRFSNIFSFALLLSMIPAIVCQAYAMSSHEFYDNGYIVSKGLKAFSYLVPFLGLSLNYMQNQKSEESLLKKLTEREYFITRLTGSAPNAIYLFSMPHGDLMYSNRNILSILGYDESVSDSLGQRPFSKIVAPEDKQVIEAHMADVLKLKDEQVYEFEFRVLDASGELRWLSCREVVFARDEQGLPSQILGGAFDITALKQTQEQLDASKKQFEAIFNQTFQFIGLFDTEGRILKINQSGLNLLQIEMEAVRGLYAWDLACFDVFPASREKLKNAVHKAAAGFTDHTRLEITKPNGSIAITDFSIKPIRDINGKVVQLLPEAHDITENARSAEKVERSERFLAQAQKLAKLGSWEWNVKTNSLYWSEEVYQIHGFDSEKDKPDFDSWMHTIVPENRDYVLSAINTALENGENYEVEFRCQGKRDGRYRTIFTRGLVVRDDNGAPLSMMGTTHDVSEQREFTDRLLKSSSLYRSLAQNIPKTWVLLFDTNLTCTLSEGVLPQLPGFNPGETEGTDIRPITELLLSGELPAGNQTEDLLKSVLNGSEHSFERSSSGLYYCINFLPVRDENGVVIYGMLKVSNDTENVNRRKELESMVAELNRSNTELEQFAYIASHDLQEPLRKINTLGGRLADKAGETLSPEGLDYLRRMQNAAMRMNVLISDLLQYSRVGRRNMHEFTEVKLDNVLENALSDLESVINKANAQIEFTNLPVVSGDETRLEQLFRNLISNAVKFTKTGESPRLSISARPASEEEMVFMDLKSDFGYCTVQFRDYGIGFDNKYADRIFTIFQRLHNRSDYEGTGIGLAICRKVAENHGGILIAEGKPGEGAVFTLYIPGTMNNIIPTKELIDEKAIADSFGS
ncbi:MAG: PAS domain-containing protein [Bacteroidota bacterium]